MSCFNFSSEALAGPTVAMVLVRVKWGRKAAWVGKEVVEFNSVMQAARLYKKGTWGQKSPFTGRSPVKNRFYRNLLTRNITGKRQIPLIAYTQHPPTPRRQWDFSSPRFVNGFTIRETKLAF